GGRHGDDVVGDGVGVRVLDVDREELVPGDRVAIDQDVASVGELDTLAGVGRDRVALDPLAISPRAVGELTQAHARAVVVVDRVALDEAVRTMDLDPGAVGEPDRVVEADVIVQDLGPHGVVADPVVAVVVELAVLDRGWRRRRRLQRCDPTPGVVMAALAVDAPARSWSLPAPA